MYAEFRTGKFRPGIAFTTALISFIYQKTAAKSDAGIKDAFEEMEHEFPLETFRPRKQGRFPFNENVKFEFRQLPVANGTAFSKLF